MAAVAALPASIRLMRRNSSVSVSVAVTMALAVAMETEQRLLLLHLLVNPLRTRPNPTRSELALESSSPLIANHSAGNKKKNILHFWLFICNMLIDNLTGVAHLQLRRHSPWPLQDLVTHAIIPCRVAQPERAPEAF